MRVEIGVDLARGDDETWVLRVDRTADTIPAPPDDDARRAHFPKRCACCRALITYAAWMALPSRRPWPELGLEVAECPVCPEGARNTLSIPFDQRHDR